jgi:Fe-S oxidoreductase
MEYQDLIHRCFRCGYCKFTRDYRDFNCPTYRKFWFETYSPGGRMWLLRGMLNGDVKPSQRLAEIFYSCVTCGNCAEHCVFEFGPDLVNIFVEARRELVERGMTPPAVRDYLKGIHVHGNPYKQTDGRGEWAQGLNIAPYHGQEYLFYVGCVGSYDDRGKQMARAAASLLSEAGISFGVLGDKEPCDGNEVRLLGESGLFQELAENNIKMFKSLGVRKIIALSPHGYNAFKKKYPAYGGDFEVVHYSHALAQLVAAGTLALSGLKAKVTYHDPCYLGRHNDEFDAPREILRAVPGLSLVEMEKNKKDALCCGGGGGNFFTEIIGSGEGSPARVRLREAAETGANMLAVACPYCARMFEDALKSESLEGVIEVKDVAEIAVMAGPRRPG